MSKFIKVADPAPGWKAPIVLGWAGMRGVVSLAAALSIPVALTSGEAFPNRDMILFITFTVILVTLVVQGLTLPMVIKWLKLPNRDSDLSLEKQKQLVRKKLSHLSLNILEDNYKEHTQNNGMVKALKIKYAADMDLLVNCDTVIGEACAADIYKDYRQIVDHLLKEQRALLQTMNKKENISDELIRHQMDLLDLEEENLRQLFEEN
jgi:CPA1 family monovalent cation:H+ antiporter